MIKEMNPRTVKAVLGFFLIRKLFLSESKQKFIILFKNEFFPITFFRRKKKVLRGAAPRAAYFD